MIRESMIRRIKEGEFMRKRHFVVNIANLLHTIKRFIKIIELKSFSIFINNVEKNHINMNKLDYLRD